MAQALLTSATALRQREMARAPRTSLVGSLVAALATFALTPAASAGLGGRAHLATHGLPGADDWLALAAPAASADALAAECARLREQLERTNAEISALKRGDRGVRDDYRLRKKMADAEALARQL